MSKKKLSPESVAEQKRKKALKELARLGRGGKPRYPSDGLCRAVSCVTGHFLRGLFPYHYDYALEAWPHFSGSYTYPVPRRPRRRGGSHSTDTRNKWKRSRSAAEQAYADTNNLWIGTYGKLRRSLARHLVRHLSKRM